MFAILFGLSTDYNVFLLSRVREEWERLGHVAPAVARASARTRRTITSAGAIMIVVFLGFTTDPDSTIKMAGSAWPARSSSTSRSSGSCSPPACTLLGDRLWRRRTPAARCFAGARSVAATLVFLGRAVAAIGAWIAVTPVGPCGGCLDHVERSNLCLRQEGSR